MCKRGGQERNRLARYLQCQKNASLINLGVNLTTMLFHPNNKYNLQTKILFIMYN